jgi:MFS family permease
MPNAARALLAGTFINRLGSFLQVFVVLYLVDSGYTATHAAGALSAYSAGSIVGMLIGGGLSDRFGARRTIVVSMLCSSALLLGFYYLDPYAAKVATITLVGMMSQAYRPAATSMLTELTPKTGQLMVFAMNRLAVNLGATALPLVGIALAAVSFALLFWVEAVAAALFAGIAATALPETRTHSTTKKRYRALLGDRGYLLFLASMLTHSTVYVQYLAILPLFLLAHDFPPVVYGILMSINGALVIGGELFITKLVGRWPARKTIIAGMALTGLGMSLYAPEWGIAGLVIATIIWTSGEMVGAPTIYFAYPAQIAPPESRGRYFGAANAMFGLGNTIGPLAGIAAWTIVGDAVWLLCGLVTSAAIATAWLATRHQAAASIAASRPSITE